LKKMPSAIIGKKLGMTQRFAEDGSVIPMTVIQAGPCVVVQRKTRERDGYEAIQVGLVEPGRRTRVNKPLEGHFEKVGVAPVKVLREFRLDRGRPAKESEEEVKVGDSIKVSVFTPDDKVNVKGISKGKGFAGVMKRHGFGGGRATHGSMFHRAPGSIGMAAYPARVLKGMKMPGQMGNKQVTVKNLQVVEVNEEENLLLLRGAVPGAPGTYLEIVKSK
jgi:large subunit ribosomal protein L3